MVFLVQLVEAGADIETVDKEGENTPLFLASKKGHSDVVQYLLQVISNLSN